jgi:hypothetical protein
MGNMGIVYRSIISGRQSTIAAKAESVVFLPGRAGGSVVMTMTFA